MKQVVQNYKKGTLTLEEVPAPALKSGGALVRTHHSLISAGTEKMKLDDSKKSYVGMARARPEQVKKLMETLRQQGPLATYRKVMNRLDSFTPLGYSLAGRVMEVGEGAAGFAPGDMVACAGAELANHAEINWLPKNLMVKIPRVSPGVAGDENGLLPTEQASFATVGAIAMQGVRQANVNVGENVMVIGLGLVGLLVCQILKAAGCRTLGVDLDRAKVDLALRAGADAGVVVGEADAAQAAASFSGGVGMDAVILASSSSSNEPIVLAGEAARDRAMIVNVGINKMDVPWKLYFAKELTLTQSRSYGPGRYDPYYESLGHDYPVGYVRWTENRNMASFLQLMASGRIDVRPLITHRFDFEKAPEAYDLIEGRAREFYVGIVLAYDTGEARLAEAGRRSMDLSPAPAAAVKGVGLGMIGAGNFARTMLLPHLQSLPGVTMECVCTTTGVTAKDTARKFGFRSCSTDYRDMLADERVNTVLVATRHNLHGRMVIESLKAGKHTYVEKPLAMKPGELEAIRDTWNARTTDVKLFVGFNRRFAPLVRQTREFFGQRSEPMVMSYRVNAGFMDKNNWYQMKDVGGGRIIGEVCHFIDTLQYLTGADPVGVYARAIATGNAAVTAEDNVIVTLAFSDGSVGSITYLANGDPGFPKEYLEVFCENKVAVMNNFSSLTTMANGKMKTKKAYLQDKGHKAEMAAFVESVAGGAPMPIPFDSLYLTTKAAFRIHESLDRRAEVSI